MADLTGRTLGKYEIVERLASGSLADVYRAHDPGLNCDMALKVFHPPLAGDAAFLEQLREEVRLAASLRHPHIARVYECGTAQVEGRTLPYLVAEFAEGATLKERLASYRASGKTMPLLEVLDLFRVLGSALDYAHRHQVVHGGLKPGNILFTAGGEPLLVDFGVARTVAARVQALPADATGTPAYMAPEQARGAPVDARTDVYALGVLLYELCTNTLPFSADTPTGVLMRHLTEPPPPPRQANPALPEAVERVILKALAKSPADRYASAGEMVAALEGALVGAAPSAPLERAEVPAVPPTPPTRPEAPPAVPPLESILAEEEEEVSLVAKKKEVEKHGLGIRNFLIQILAIFTTVLALLEKFTKAVDIMRNPLIGFIVVGVGLAAMVVSAGYVLARPGLYKRWQRILAAAGLALTVLAAAGWGGWTLYDMHRPPKGLIVLIADFERDPDARAVNYARRVETGLNEALKRLKVEGVYVERSYEVYTEENARSKAAARKAALVIYGWYDDAGINPRFELVRAPQEYMPILKQAPVDLVELEKLDLRVGRELKEMQYIAAAAIGLAYYADGQMAQALSFFNLALESAPEEAHMMGRESVYFYKGTTHFYLHQFSQALEAMQEAVRLAPNLYEAHHNLAILYSVNCDLDAALRETDEALRLKPDSGDAYYFRGVLLMAQNRWEEAAEALVRAAELSPDNAAIQAALGKTYETLGRADEAAAAYQKATALSGEELKEKKDDPRAIAAHADILASQGKPEEALAEYQRAIQRAEALGLRPDRLAWLYRSLGSTYLDLERWAEAVEAYERAVALSPGLPTDHSSLGIAYQHLEQYDRAVAAYQKALAILPCDANTHDLLGDLYRKLGKVDEALHEYQESVRYAPDDFTAWHAIGQILEERGQMDEAKAAYEKAVAAAEAYLKRNPRDATVTYTLGLMYLLLGDAERAIALLQKALALQPSAEGHRALGNAYSEAGEYEKALEEYQAALALDPQNVATWVALGNTYDKLGRTEEAIAAYRQSLALQEDADVHVYIAMLLEKQGKTDEAEAEYKASLQVKDNALAHLGLAGIYERAGRTEEAIAEYKAALPLTQDPAIAAQIHITLARLYGQLGRTEEALGEYQVALALLSEDPNLDGTRATVAFSLLERCRLEEALSVLQPALTRKEGKPSLEALMAGGLVYAALGRDAEAAAVYATMLREYPDAVAAHYLAAWFAYHQDHLEEAIGEMQKAVELDVEFFPAWKDLGYFLDMQGDLVGARSAYSKTLEILPSHVNAWMGLGEIALQEGKPREALGLFQEALRQYPEFAKRVQDGLQTGLISIHLDLALAYEWLGLTSEAVQERATARAMAEEIAAKAPSNSQALFQLAAVYWASGEAQKAEASLAQAVQCNATLTAQWERLKKRFALLRGSP